MAKREPERKPIVVPPLVQGALLTRIAYFEQREFDVRGIVRGIYDPLFTSYREEMEAEFYRHFNRVVDPKTGRPIWEVVTAVQTGSTDRLLASFDEMVQAAQAAAEELIEEELAEGYEEGYFLGLWMLGLSGADVTANPPSRDMTHAALLAAGVAGLAFPDRLNVWTNDARQRWGSMLRADVARGAELGETVDDLILAGEGLMGRVFGLAGDELHRGYILGADLAFAQHADLMEGSVWVTRNDPLVCEICMAKHLTITDEQPIEDSHPHCRCTKVPIMLTPGGTPVDYVQFLQQIGVR